MKKSLFKENEFPSAVSILKEGNMIVVKGPLGENKKEFDFGKLNVEIKENKIKIWNEKSTKREKKMMHTISAHIKNMIKGVQEKFEYKLKICSGHFPMTVKIEGSKAIIKNYFGEKKERIVNIPKNVEVQIDKDMITISSTNIEYAGQASANFEAVVSLRNKDRRIFQDGIYIINKAGRDL